MLYESAIQSGTFFDRAWGPSSWYNSASSSKLQGTLKLDWMTGTDPILFEITRTPRGCQGKLEHLQVTEQCCSDFRNSHSIVRTKLEDSRTGEILVFADEQL
jgi:hypothetical protein